jgi:hypothetical protein
MKDTAGIKALHPCDVEERNLQESHLVLVDHRLEYWPDRDAAPYLSLKVLNGFALAEVLRSHIDQMNRPTPTAFAIYTGHLVELAGNLPPDSRPQVIAKTHNLEWTFSKDTGSAGVPLPRQILSLARAVQELPSSWSLDNLEKNQELTCGLLRLSLDGTWFSAAWEEIRRCHPPIHELSEWTHGIAFLRWMLHQILPYPCFLWNLHYLAARFRVTYESLNRAWQEDQSFRGVLEPYAYRGVLCDFLGERWWRPGIETFLWERLEKNSFDIDALRGLIRSLTKYEVTSTGFGQPVVCVNKEQQFLNELCDVGTCVRIQPDDWPSFADPAWTSVELAMEFPYLKSLVVERDLSHLE